jgi:antitoxin Phd
VNSWPVQDAKSRFSELIDQSLTDGPQVVTRHGRATAVVIPYAQWQMMQALALPDLKAVLLDKKSPRFELTLPDRGALKSRKAGADVFA